jgi:hypothetical protein
MKLKLEKPLLRTLTACGVISLLVFVWLYSLDGGAFRALVETPDTSSYTDVALTLTATGTLIPSPRTLGYPLFLALGYIIAGSTYGLYLIVAAQLLLNLVFTWGCWKLLVHLAPDVKPGLRIAATLFFFWAGLGMAILVISDFLASFFFGVFFYGLLFWRSRLAGLLSGTFLALATFVRPTFTFVPLVLPLAAYLVGRITSRLSWRYILTYIVMSLGATAVSISYQYYSFGYVGPSDVVAKNIGRTLHHASKDKAMTLHDYQAFRERIAKEAGMEADALLPTDEEPYAKKILLDELQLRPGVILVQIISTAIKYIFVPVESFWSSFVRFYGNDQMYQTYVRPFLGLACLPLWVLALIPPQGSTHRKKPYYLLVMIFLLYVVGLTAINPGQGERIRFPVLAGVFPIILWNVRDLRSAYYSAKTPRRSARSSTLLPNKPSIE